MKIGHIHILVNNVGVSKQFYQEKFGFSKVAEADFGVVLHDDSGIDFVISPAANGAVQGQRMHFGFRLESPLAVKEKFEQLDASGQAFISPYVENNFITLFSLNDPDGNLVEVYYADEIQG